MPRGGGRFGGYGRGGGQGHGHGGGRGQGQGVNCGQGGTGRLSPSLDSDHKKRPDDQTPAGIDVYMPAENFWRPSEKKYMPFQRTPQTSSLDDPMGMDKYRFPVYSRPPNRLLPDFFAQYPLMYQPPDILYDEFNRQYRFTDRVTDSWHRLWIGTAGDRSDTGRSSRTGICPYKAIRGWASE